jgi:release factor glutamine methyltransferase
MQTGARSACQLARDAAERLECAGVPEPVASAEVLLSELLGVRRSELALLEEPLTQEEEEAPYEAWISRRSNREPVQRILGYAYFRNLRLELDEHTLIPRPDTESVVDAVLEAIDRRAACGFEKTSTFDSRLPAPESEATCRVLDIGTGSGAIAISVAQERPFCDVHATDYSEDVLRIARRNLAWAGTRVRLHRAVLTSGLEALTGSVDVLVSNPPYVRSADISKLAPEVRDWDPHVALDGGPDGLDFYRRIFTEAVPLLADGADVVLEVGDGQAGAVLELGWGAGYEPLGTRPDLTGAPRAVLLRWGLA